jgi:hypothetical protein
MTSPADIRRYRESSQGEMIGRLIGVAVAG